MDEDSIIDRVANKSFSFLIKDTNNWAVNTQQHTFSEWCKLMDRVYLSTLSKWTQECEDEQEFLRAKAKKYADKIGDNVNGFYNLSIMLAVYGGTADVMDFIVESCSGEIPFFDTKFNAFLFYSKDKVVSRGLQIVD